MAFNYHSDAAHGWLEVSKDDVLSVGLTSNDFSRFSYYDGAGALFLEEDCDMPLFCKAYRKTHGLEIKVRDLHTSAGCADHFIRSLASL